MLSIEDLNLIFYIWVFNTTRKVIIKESNSNIGLLLLLGLWPKQLWFYYTGALFGPLYHACTLVANAMMVSNSIIKWSVKSKVHIDMFLFWYQHKPISILRGRSKRSIGCQYSIHILPILRRILLNFPKYQVMVVNVFDQLFFPLFSWLLQPLLEK